MIGDSTMADKVNPEINPEHGWGQLLPRFFDDDVVVHNHAVNGRSTKSFIDEGRWATVVHALQPGDYVFIEFGHNDEKKEDSTRYAAANGSYRRNLERFVAETRAHGAMPVVLTPIVRRKFDAAGRLENTHGEYVGAAIAAARATRATLIDLEALTRSVVQRAGVDSSKRLFVYVAAGESPMYPDGRQDDTHLSLAGAAEVARLVAIAIERSGLPLAHDVRSLGDHTARP